MSPVPERPGPEIEGLTYEKGLGQGGYAEVYLYVQSNPHMRVAVKVLSGDGLSEDTKERFAAEANAMAQLADHPYIVQVFQTGVTKDGRPYLVMKYYPQRNMAERARRETLTVPEVLRTGVQIASAVETAHRAGIIHRDIKPHNILTSQYGAPGLTDFGIASTTAVDGITDSGGMSVPWAPPEVLSGASSGDRAGDIYALGATLWHLLTGRSPFETPGGDNTNLALIRRIRHEAPPRTDRDDVPLSLERLLAQAMAKAPDNRPATALQLARSLQAIEAEQHWAPTPTTILDLDGENIDLIDDGESTTNPRADTDLRTHVRTPQAPQARALQAPLRSQQPISVPSFDDPPTQQGRRAPVPVGSGNAERAPLADRARQTAPAAPEPQATVQRATPGPTVAADAAPKLEPPSRRRTWRLAIASVAVVAVIVVAGLLLSNHNGGSSSATTLGAPPPTIGGTEPSAPTVTASKVGADQVKFVWTEQDPQPGDDFRYQLEGSNTWIPSTGDDVVLPVGPGGQVCLTVQVGRDDNQELSPQSSYTCSS